MVYILFLLICIFQLFYTSGGLLVQLNNHNRTKGKRSFGFPTLPHLTPTWLFQIQGYSQLSALVARMVSTQFGLTDYVHHLSKHAH